MVTAVNMAIEDFGGKVLGRPIEVLSANYQNKVDIASARAREWYDRDDVDMIIESTDSAAALALQRIGVEKRKLPFCWLCNLSANQCGLLTLWHSLRL